MVLMSLQVRLGSGKTLIIESLQLLSGEKVSKDLIRSGEKEAIVEADIVLDDTTNRISRSININGKSICKINGINTKLSEYKEYMKGIIDIHDQNDNQNILDINTHIEFVDLYADGSLDYLKDEYANLYEQYLHINSELSKNYGDDKEKQRMPGCLQELLR